MNETLIKIAEQYEKTANELLRKAQQLRNGINPNKCKHGEYTNMPFNGCKTCGKKYRVICSNENVSPKIRNSGGCNPTNCKYFTAKT